MSAKKSTNVVLKKKRNGKPNALHEKLIKLFTRPNGATMHDTYNAGFEYPAMAALKIAERRASKPTSSRRAAS